jgi:hypothetical protein
MRAVFNFRFQHSFVSQAGGAGSHSIAWEQSGDYRNSGSFRLCGPRVPKQVFQAVPRMKQGRFAAFGSVRLMAAACPRFEGGLSPSAFAFGAEPNKAPEPTTFAVTSRAIEGGVEMKQQNPNRNVARAAPAKVVAHL